MTERVPYGTMSTELPPLPPLTPSKYSYNVAQENGENPLEEFAE